MKAASHVVAVAGRRIDPEPAEIVRFPFDRVGAVETALRQLFEEVGAAAVVSSAACGADLLALKAAGSLKIPTRIILPFNETDFKQTSVLDRPRKAFWSEMFDSAIAAARAHGEVVVLRGDKDEADYSMANKAIIETALSMVSGRAAKGETRALGRQPVAVLVWEGKARSGSDLTDEFRQLATKASFEIRTVLTICESGID